MNRKKKINQVLKSKVKKMNAKLQKSNKPKYVSKAERERIALEEAAQNDNKTKDETSEEQMLLSQINKWFSWIGYSLGNMFKTNIMNRILHPIDICPIG